MGPRGTARCRLLRGSWLGIPMSTTSDSAGGGRTFPSSCLTYHTTMLPRKTTSRSSLKVFLASSAVPLASSAKADRAAGTISPVSLSATLLRLTDTRRPGSRPCTLQESLQCYTALPVPRRIQAIAVAPKSYDCSPGSCRCGASSPARHEWPSSQSRKLPEKQRCATDVGLRAPGLGTQTCREPGSATMQLAGMQGPGCWQLTVHSTTGTGNPMCRARQSRFSSPLSNSTRLAGQMLRSLHTPIPKTTVRSPARMPLRLQPCW